MGPRAATEADHRPVRLVVVGLALGSVATGSNLSALLGPLSEVFVPVFLLAVFLAIVLYVIGQLT